jgi:hypothetical protein
MDLLVGVVIEQAPVIAEGAEIDGACVGGVVDVAGEASEGTGLPTVETCRVVWIVSVAGHAVDLPPV